MPKDTSDREPKTPLYKSRASFPTSSDESKESPLISSGAPQLLPSSRVVPHPPFFASSDFYSKESEHKSHNVTADVISLVARLAVEDTPGMFLAEEPSTGGWGSRLWGRPGGSAVQLRIEEEKISVFVRLAVAYGVEIRSVAREVQRRVCEDVKSFTGYDTVTVDVFIGKVHQLENGEAEGGGGLGDISKGEPAGAMNSSTGDLAKARDRQGEADFSQAQDEGGTSVTDKG